MIATPQLGFHVDMRICLGCATCSIACQDKNDLPAGQRFRRVVEVEGGSYTQQGSAILPDVFAYWISIACNHCTSPACVANCPSGACRKRASDGVVVIDPEVCIGCRFCTMSCPYGAPQYNPATGKSGKCNLCIDLIERGEEPACVAACPVRAIHVGPADELASRFGGSMDLGGLPDPAITRPNGSFTPHRHAVRATGRR